MRFVVILLTDVTNAIVKKESSTSHAIISGKEFCNVFMIHFLLPYYLA